MHNNYYFLRKLSIELEKIISGAVVSECFSQNKDELIIRFEKGPKPFFIKASLQAGFCCLSFPTEFTRARRNSVDLFGALIGQQVEKITQFANERSFAIELPSLTLLFKMHGNRANIVLFESEKVIELFRNHMTADAEINAKELNRTIDWSYEAFEKNVENLPQLYFTFGKGVWNFLNRNSFDEKSVVEKWGAIQDLRSYLEKPTYYIAEIDNKLILSFFPDGNIVKKFTNPIHAVDEFFLQFTKTFSFFTEKNEILSALRVKLQNGMNYLKKAYQKKKEIEHDTHYKIWADVLIANLNQIKPGAEKITLPDFYNENKPIEIKLKRDHSAQKNAEVFYRKSKNHQIEVQKLKEGIARKEKDAADILAIISTVQNAPDMKTLKGLVESSGLKQEAAKKENPLPYHEIEYNGFKIWIGKNAKHNDTLTLKHTFKEDLWFHAKDVAGSHVVVKYQSGKKFPKDVIERAAQLAAYNSKRKTDSLCPVAYTPKKYVRKRKGDPAGAVVVERENVILVEPRNF